MDSHTKHNLISHLCLASDEFSSLYVSQQARRLGDKLSLPVHLVELVMLIEDKRFPFHFGIDPIAITRALFSNIAGRAVQGASTIPQQIYNVRRSTRKRPSRTLLYKVTQTIFGALYCARYSKAALLSEYINNVYLGRSYYGIENAARGYFGIEVSSLTVLQSFFLAERIANPNKVSPMRIVNLLERNRISACLSANSLVLRDLVKVYGQVFDSTDLKCLLASRLSIDSGQLILASEVSGL